MALFRPKYRDPKSKKLVQASIWWYQFFFAGRRIRESSKSARKTIAAAAEMQRRLELERGVNNVKSDRADRIRPLSEVAATHLEDYKLRHPQSSTFAKYALGHVTRLLGRLMTIDVTETTVTGYQIARLKEKGSPKSINEEVVLLLRIMGEQSDALRAKLKRKKNLKLKVQAGVAKAFSPEAKAALLAEAKKRRSPTIYPALMLALHSGLRDAELRGLQWGRMDLHKAIVTVGDSKTEAGQGRTVPLNTDVLEALVAHAKWFLSEFGAMKPDHYVFPFGKPRPSDPTRQATSFRTVWANVKKAAGVTGRWHDNRHTFITDLAEGGEASDETIMDMAGHVSKRMLKHYSHIRMEAKRRAVNSLNVKPKGDAEQTFLAGVSQEMTQVSKKAN